MMLYASTVVFHAWEISVGGLCSQLDVWIELDPQFFADGFLLLFLHETCVEGWVKFFGKLFPVWLLPCGKAFLT